MGNVDYGRSKLPNEIRPHATVVSVHVDLTH